ncbi:hypothetical protein [Thermolongibacillus altinsuensis]|uniref:hypothetical protein n=1 Tax=Thermolongibacillus altinsuensis TaxID=575256 RepID=UPI00104B680B|nr:hypothetical protein [Thermolongibacillus altinsuensis]
MPSRHASSMPIPNVKRIADKFVCPMAFSFGEVAEKFIHVGKLRLSYLFLLDIVRSKRKCKNGRDAHFDEICYGFGYSGMV